MSGNTPAIFRGLAPLRAAWQQRPARERRLLVLAGMVLGAALLWQWGLAPALATWRSAPQRQAELDNQTRQMLQLQAQARQLQAPGRVPRADAVRRLETSARELLGAQARLHVQGDQLRLSLNAAPASGLAQWLQQAREQAQALPQSARLQRADSSANTPPASPASPATSTPRPPASATEPLWQGELSLRLP